MSSRLRRVGGERAAILVAATAALAGCSESKAPDDELDPVRAAEISRVVPVSELLSQAHIPTLDPAEIERAEIEKALGPGDRCEFRYASYARPVLAMTASTGAEEALGVVKLNGKLVILEAVSDGGATTLAAENVRIRLATRAADASGGLRSADMLFEVGDDLRAGYRGYYSCVE